MHSLAYSSDRSDLYQFEPPEEFLFLFQLDPPEEELPLPQLEPPDEFDDLRS